MNTKSVSSSVSQHDIQLTSVTTKILTKQRLKLHILNCEQI